MLICNNYTGWCCNLIGGNMWNFYMFHPFITIHVNFTFSAKDMAIQFQVLIYMIYGLYHLDFQFLLFHVLFLKETKWLLTYAKISFYMFHDVNLCPQCASITSCTSCTQKTSCHSYNSNMKSPLSKLAWRFIHKTQIIIHKFTLSTSETVSWYWKSQNVHNPLSTLKPSLTV